MSTAENKQLITEAFAAWGRGENGAVFKLMSDDLRWTIIGKSPVSGVFNSKKEFLAVAKAMTEELTAPLRVHVRDIIAEDDRVAVLWEGHSAGRNGTAYDQSYCWVLKLDNGRIREGYVYLDTALLDRLFGSK